MSGGKLLYALALAMSGPLYAVTEQSALGNGNESGRTQMELGASYDVLSRNQGYWRTEYLNFEHRFSGRQQLYGSLLQTERFKLNDEQFLLGGNYPLAAKLLLNVEGSISPSPQVLANHSLTAALQAELGLGWVLGGGYRRSEYRTGPLQQASVVLENYFSDFRAAYSSKVTDSFGESRFGQRLDFSWYYQDANFVNLTYSTGAEVGGYQGIVYQTQFFGLRGRHWFSRDWAVGWEIGRVKQGEAYTREGGGIGLRWAF